MKVLITGANGFIAKNLKVHLQYSFHDDIEIFEYVRGSKHQDLIDYIKAADFIFHLAGENRPKDISDFVTGNDKGLGTSDMLKLDINLPIKYNGTLFSDFASNQSISKAANFAGGGGLEFGLLDLSGNIIAALDRDASGTFNAGDLALDVQDNVTSVAYNASNDVFTFIV